jgi:hypothetical protein
MYNSTHDLNDKQAEINSNKLAMPFFVLLGRWHHVHTKQYNAIRRLHWQLRRIHILLSIMKASTIA